MISQNLFDETVLENEELFELSPEEALMETMYQFEKSGQSSVAHLALSHPSSPEGKRDRRERLEWNDSLTKIHCSNEDDEEVLDHLKRLHQGCTGCPKSLTSMISVIHQSKSHLATLLSLLTHDIENPTDLSGGKGEIVRLTLQILVLVLPKLSSTVRDAARQHQVLSTPMLQLAWLEHDSVWDDELSVSMFNFLYACCKNNEGNKKVWVSQESLHRLVDTLRASSNQQLGLAACQFVAVLCRFDDFRQNSSGPPSIASGHDTVMELSRCGLVPVLKDWSEKADPEVLPAVMTAIRVIAVHDDIVQSMVAVGLLDTATSVVINTDNDITLLTSTIGMLRNVSANDEIKSNLANNDTILDSIFKIALSHLDLVLLQEHALGLISAMALRKPQNAHKILARGGARVVLCAMKRHSTNKVVQRQGALAIRNLASRASVDEKHIMLDLDAEALLQQAGRVAVDEAYAALRDLGCSATKTTIHEDGTITTGPQMFGQVKSSFRAVYEQS